MRPEVSIIKCSSYQPESGVNTHPQVVRAVVRLLKEIDCRVYLGDGPATSGELRELGLSAARRHARHQQLK